MDIRVYDNRVCCILVDKDLEPYGLSVECLASRQPFGESLILDLMNQASEITHKDYDVMDSKLNIETYSNMVVISFEEKSNLVYLENSFINTFEVTEDLHSLFKDLPDEKIHLGLMEVKEKEKLLEKIRSDEGKEIIRKHYFGE